MSSNADQFAATDREINHAADAIAKRVATLLQKTARYEDIAADYVVEQLIVALLRRDSGKALAWLDRQRGEGSIRLAEALKDWLDLWGAR